MINITKQFEYVLYKWYDWLVHVDDNLISWCQKIARHTPPFDKTVSDAKKIRKHSKFYKEKDYIIKDIEKR